MNTVNLIGRWVREHDVHEGNTTVVKNTLAVDHPFKKDDSSFIRVVMFGKTGELANQYTGKGSQVAITGHIQTGSYEKPDGTKIFTTDVIANNIKFLEPKKENAAPNIPADLNNPNSGNYNTPNNTQNNAQGYQAPAQTNSQGGQYNANYGGSGQGQGYQQPQTQQSNYNQPIEVEDDDLPF